MYDVHHILCETIKSSYHITKSDKIKGERMQKRILSFMLVLNCIGSSIYAMDLKERATTTHKPNYVKALGIALLLGTSPVQACSTSFSQEISPLEQATCDYYAKHPEIFVNDSALPPKDKEQVAQCFFQGVGVENDPAQVIKLLSHAAESGSATAQYNLGNCYWKKQEKGIEPNEELAEKWLLSAAKQGLADAQYDLAWFYYDRGNGKEDFEKAADWGNRAAQNGHQGAIADRMKYSCFLAPYSKNALKWCIKSAKDDSYWETKPSFWISQACIQEKLGHMYLEGQGNIKKNFDTGITWLVKAAETDRSYRERSAYLIGENFYKEALRMHKIISSKKVVKKPHGGMGKAAKKLKNVPTTAARNNNINAAFYWLKQAERYGDPRAHKLLNTMCFTWPGHTQCKDRCTIL